MAMNRRQRMRPEEKTAFDGWREHPASTSWQGKHAGYRLAPSRARSPARPMLCTSRPAPFTVLQAVTRPTSVIRTRALTNSDFMVPPFGCERFIRGARHDVACKWGILRIEMVAKYSAAPVTWDVRRSGGQGHFFGNKHRRRMKQPLGK
jgi:hypothetical protein